MLSFRCRNESGETFTLASPLTVGIKTDENVPADILEGVFAFQPVGRLSEIEVLRGGECVFRGIPDEQKTLFSADGKTLWLTARSPAALLLDNEAQPCSYDHPSANFIFHRYAEPFGLTKGEDGDAVYFGEMSVIKGASCWSVLRNFSVGCYSSLPRVSGSGTLYLKGMPRGKRLLFGDGGIRYSRFCESYKRCEELSAVYLKTSASDGYTFAVENKAAIARGVRRVRYLNAMTTPNPVQCAEAMLSGADRKAYSLELRCPGCLVGLEGSDAAVRTDDGLREDLTVCGLRYRMDENGEYTDVIMRRRTN